MTNERRYRDEEVRQIFEAAARESEVDGRALVSTEGPTLAELQVIGREVGLAPERIAQAASALDQGSDALPRQTHFGMPVAVGRIVDLPRAPTDREWELLVADLRATFGARGKVGTLGSLREWTNGNLHAYVEPTETGHRLRMGTLKGNALALTRMGLFGMGMGLVTLIALLLRGGAADGLLAPVFLGTMGAVAFTSAIFGLPRWARQREEQMEFIAARAQALIESEPAADIIDS
jgi:hypothetical protein